MNKEYFTDNLKIETIAKFTDKMLSFEKKAKNRKLIKKDLLKIVPAVAVIALVIGSVNILPVFLNNATVLPGSEIAEATADANMITPGTLAAIDNTLTDIPRIVEKSVFENLVADMPESRAKDKINAYYGLRDASHPTVSSLPFLEKGSFYIFDPRLTEREITELLSYWNQYIGWTDTEYHKMLADYGLGENELTLVMDWDNVYYEGEGINFAEAEISYDDETVTFQTGGFIITTLKGQEPFSNGDTITIPGSSIFTFDGIMRIANPNGYHSFDHGDSTFTVPDGLVISIINKTDNKTFTDYGADAVIDLLLPDNIGKEVIVERDIDGEPFKAVYDKDRNAIWNGMSAHKYINEPQSTEETKQRTEETKQRTEETKQRMEDRAAMENIIDKIRQNMQDILRELNLRESERKIIFYNNGNITIDDINIEDIGKPMDDIEKELYNKEDFPNIDIYRNIDTDSYMPDDITPTLPWMGGGAPDGKGLFTLKDGTTIQTGNKFIINGTYKLESNPEILPDYLKSFIYKLDNSCGLLMPRDKSIVTLANGIVIEAPGYTIYSVNPISDDYHDFKIIIGRGDAIITKPDGSKTTAKSGTILNNEGSIIK